MRSYLVARHTVARSLVDHAHIALVDEYEAGRHFWDVCVPGGGGVYLASAEPGYELEWGTTRDIPDDEEPQPEDYWHRTFESLALSGGLEIIEKLVESGEYGNEGDRWLYRIASREVFCRLAKRFTPVNGVPSQVLPGQLDVGVARDILRSYLLDWNSVGFQAVERTLLNSPWLYTMGECHMDVVYQQLATRDRNLLPQVLAEPLPHGFQIIALY